MRSAWIIGLSGVTALAAAVVYMIAMPGASHRGALPAATALELEVVAELVR